MSNRISQRQRITGMSEYEFDRLSPNDQVKLIIKSEMKQWYYDSRNDCIIIYKVQNDQQIMLFLIKITINDYHIQYHVIPTSTYQPEYRSCNPKGDIQFIKFNCFDTLLEYSFEIEILHYMSSNDIKISSPIIDWNRINKGYFINYKDEIKIDIPIIKKEDNIKKEDHMDNKIKKLEFKLKQCEIYKNNINDYINKINQFDLEKEEQNIKLLDSKYIKFSDITDKLKISKKELEDEVNQINIIKKDIDDLNCIWNKSLNIKKRIDNFNDYKNKLNKFKEDLMNLNINETENELKQFNDKYKKYIETNDILLKVKKDIEFKVKEIKKNKDDINNLDNDLSMECKICFTNKCDNILFCGHFLCLTCINSMKDRDNMVKCPFCKQSCQFHKIFL